MVPGQPGRYGLEGGVHPERGVCTIEGLSRVEKAERNVIPDALGASHFVLQCSVEDKQVAAVKLQFLVSIVAPYLEGAGCTE